MATQRILAGGYADLQGDLVGGTLRIGDIFTRTPLRWNVLCERCGTRTTETHERLRNGVSVCRNSGCLKADIRATLLETPAKARRLGAEKQAARQREVDDANAAKLAEQEAIFTKTQRDLGRLLRERIQLGKDEDVYVDPATVGIKLTEEAAAKFNKEQAAVYRSRNPSLTGGALTVVGEYLERNGINIVSALTIESAVRRLESFGLLNRPAPAPTPEPPPRPYVNLSVTPLPEDDEPRKHVGLDLLTGEERSYTNFQVEKMSASEFSRIFGLRRSPAADGREYGR